MCGIAGFFRSCSINADKAILRRMGEAIIHRGPDAGGEYLDDCVGLAHRRLSIIDLSSDGNQPMFFGDNRYVIVFNGEIYNYLELRAKLEKNGTVFRSRTDTEVVLALYAEKGKECLNDLNGMFAFALWDRTEKTLLLARDRIGKKPLYYYHTKGDRLAFASEIKALLQLPGLSCEIEPTAVVDFLKYLYVPAPKSIFRNIYKLPAGHWLELRAGREPLLGQYWDVDFSRKRSGNIEDAAEELLDILRDATRCRMISDVPLGAFLSGGVDSSAVVALMAAVSDEKVKTCSIGFPDRGHDETPYARDIADLFNTDHQEYMVMEHLPETVLRHARFFDEPFADSSSVPTYHVSRLARQNVTVALAGDGGDESFGGYEKYIADCREHQVRQYVPRLVLKLMQSAAHGRPGVMARKVRTLTGGALADPAVAFYRTNTFIEDELLSELLDGRLKRDTDGYDPARHTVAAWENVRGADHITCMLYTDLKTYLPDDILVKVDRMSMAHSLEVRAPILDYRVIQFAASLPSSWKIRGAAKKYLLKKTFSKILPDSILNRRKHGFTAPISDWFRCDLRGLFEDSLLNSDMSEYFSSTCLKRIWREHQEQKVDHGTLLWSLLSFSLWHKEYMGTLR